MRDKRGIKAMLARLWAFLYPSVPARFDSWYPVEESVRRLSKGVDVSQRVDSGLLTAEPYRYTGYQLEFVGGFEVDDGAVVLLGYFRLPLLTRVFEPIWLAAMCWFVIDTARDPVWAEHWDLPLVFVVLAVLLALWHRSRGRRDIDWLSAYIRSRLEGTAPPCGA